MFPGLERTGTIGEDSASWLIGIGVGLGVLLLLTGWIDPWGLFHDEFYYWACAQRPGLGYVDHPPLAPWILALSLAVAGDGVFGFGLVPALCAAGTVILTGLLARSLGAGRYGQTLAGLSVAAAPIYLAFFSFFSVNAIEILLWTGISLVLAELIRTRDERLWVLLGVLAGLCLLNKHTFLLFAFGLGVGVLASPLRAHIGRRWFWVGIALASLICLPNLYWNFAHDWPSLSFYSTRGEGILPASFADALKIQLAAMNPINLLIWVPGLYFLLFSRAARPYRPLGIAFLLLLIVILLSGQRRGDRIAAAYPIVLAAGGVVWDRWRPRRRTVARAALIAVVLFSGLALAPAVLPILSPAAVEGYFEAIGEKPEIETGDVGSSMPIFLIGRLEWERFAESVIEAWQKLPPAERQRAVVLTPHWLHASVIEYYGRNIPSPPVVSPHNAYWFWRDEVGDRDIALSVSIDPQVLADYFEDTQEIGRFDCVYCPSFRPATAIQLSRGPKRPLRELLTTWRHFGINEAAALQR